MNAYQFERISRNLQKEHGKIRKGDEEPYTMALITLEENALKIHRRHPAANDLRMMEAIKLVLNTIAGRIEGEIPDLSAFENPENILLRDALLTAFDPFTNEEIKAQLSVKGMDRFSDREFRKKYYHVPILCLMRILESIEFWRKNFGADSYFAHCEESFGDLADKDDKLNYTFTVDPDEYEELTGEKLDVEHEIKIPREV